MSNKRLNKVLSLLLSVTILLLMLPENFPSYWSQANEQETATSQLDLSMDATTPSPEEDEEPVQETASESSIQEEMKVAQEITPVQENVDDTENMSGMENRQGTEVQNKTEFEQPQMTENPVAQEEQKEEKQSGSQDQQEKDDQKKEVLDDGKGNVTFQKGYVKIPRDTILYQENKLTHKLGITAKEGYLWAETEEKGSNVEETVLAVQFDTEASFQAEENGITAYVSLQKVTELTEKEKAELIQKLKANTEVRDVEEILLPRIELIEEENVTEKAEELNELIEEEKQENGEDTSEEKLEDGENTEADQQENAKDSQTGQESPQEEHAITPEETIPDDIPEREILGTARTAKKSVNIRKEPSKKSKLIKTIAKEDREVELTSIVRINGEDWYGVVYLNKHVGYIRGDLLTDIAVDDNLDENLEYDEDSDDDDEENAKDENTDLDEKDNEDLKDDLLNDEQKEPGEEEISESDLIEDEMTEEGELSEEIEITEEKLEDAESIEEELEDVETAEEELEDVETTEEELEHTEDSEEETGDELLDYEPVTKTVEGADYSVIVSFGPESGLPENAELSVREIEPGTEEYELYQAQAIANSSMAENEQMAFLRFFDISFADEEGEEIEPTGPVSVQITFPMKQQELTDVNVLHYMDDGNVASINEVSADWNGEEEAEVTFDVDHFSVFAVMGLQAAAATVASGSDGTCIWILDSDGKLTIRPVSGDTGEMETKDYVTASWKWNPYRSEIKSVVFEGNINVGQRMHGMFNGCSNLETIDFGNINTSKVTSMAYAFLNCSNLHEIKGLKNFNTSKVQRMKEMFRGCSSLTGTLDLSNFDTSNVKHSSESMGGMFRDCSGLTEIVFGPAFKAELAQDMSYMFAGCSSLRNLDLSGFTNSSVTNVSYMFNNCYSLKDLDVSGLQTNKVTNMTYMFSNCLQLSSLDLSNFTGDAVTNLYRMFYGCSNLTNLNLSNFNTPIVTNASYMFKECGKLEEVNLASMDLRNVSNVTSFFSGNDALTKITVGDNFRFSGGTTSFTFPDYGSLDVWKNNSTGTRYTANALAAAFGSGYGATYIFSDEDRQTGEITIKLEKKDKEGKEANRENNIRLELIDENGKDVKLYWDDSNKRYTTEGASDGGTTEISLAADTGEVKVLLPIGKYVLHQENEDVGYQKAADYAFEFGAYIYKNESGADVTGYGLLNEAADDTTGRYPTDITLLNTELVGIVEVYKVDTTDIGNLKLLFLKGAEFRLWNESFDVTRATDEKGKILFEGLSLTTYSLQETKAPDGYVLNDTVYTISFDRNGTGVSVTNNEAAQLNIQSLLRGNQVVAVVSVNALAAAPTDAVHGGTSGGCDWWIDSEGTLTICPADGSSGQLAQVTAGAQWLAYASDINKVVFEKGVVAAENSSYLFSDCVNLKEIQFGDFNTTYVTDMSYMFHGCSLLTSLDLSAWDTGNVTNMEYMFYGCTALTGLELTHFKTEKVNSIQHMFDGCATIRNLDISGWNLTSCRKAYEAFYRMVNLETLILRDVQMPQEWTLGTNGTDLGIVLCYNLKTIDATGSQIYMGKTNARGTTFPDGTWRFSESGLLYNAHEVYTELIRKAVYRSPACILPSGIYIRETIQTAGLENKPSTNYIIDDLSKFTYKIDDTCMNAFKDSSGDTHFRLKVNLKTDKSFSAGSVTNPLITVTFQDAAIDENGNRHNVILTIPRVELSAQQATSPYYLEVLQIVPSGNCYWIRNYCYKTNNGTGAVKAGVNYTAVNLKIEGATKDDTFLLYANDLDVYNENNKFEKNAEGVIFQSGFDMNTLTLADETLTKWVEGYRDDNGYLNYLIGTENDNSTQLSGFFVAGTAGGAGATYTWTAGYSDGCGTLFLGGGGVTVVRIEKQDEDGKKLAGAHLQLHDESGSLVREWITAADTEDGSNNPKNLILNSGLYRLSEVSAPAGRQLAEDIWFRVNPDGTISVSRDGKDGHYQTQGNEIEGIASLIMVNKYSTEERIIENKRVQGGIEIIKKDAESGALLSNVRFTLQGVPDISGKYQYVEGINNPGDRDVVSYYFPTGSNVGFPRDAAGNFLSYQTYKLTTEKTGTTANGKVTFADIPQGVYVLSEISTLDHYMALEDRYWVQVGSDGTAKLYKQKGAAATMVTVSDEQLILPSGVEEVSESTITNKRVREELKVTKNVSGNMGNRAKYFEMTITLVESEYVSGTADQTYVIDLTDAEASPDGRTNPTTITVSNGSGTANVWIRHGQTVKIEELPYGIQYSVSEASEGYTAAYQLNGGDKQNGTGTDQRTLTEDTTVAFNNELTVSIPTGIQDSILPAAVGSMIALVLLMVLAEMRRGRSIRR